MGFQPPKKQGIQRVSETDNLRQLETNSPNFLDDTQQKGKFCKACNKYYGYLKTSDIICKNCTCRLEMLDK